MLRSIWRWIAARYVFVSGTMHRLWANRTHDVVEYQRAVDAFSRAVELDPNFVEAYYSRGVLYWRELRNPYRAIRDLTRVMDMLPERAESWFNRAQAHMMRGDYHLAIADLEHYLTIGHDSGWRSSAATQLMLLRDLEVEKQAKRARQGCAGPG